MTTTNMPESGYPRSLCIPIEDAVQAVIAALGFNQDAGFAALSGYQDDEREGIREAGDSRTTIFPGGGVSVRVTVGARNLLALAQTEFPIRMFPSKKYDRLTSYDLTDAQPSSVVGFRLGSED